MEEESKVRDINETTVWYLPSKGKHYWHRLDGPAIEFAGVRKEWWVDNKLHRVDGPAVELVDGRKEWWVDDKRLDTKEVESWLEANSINLKTKEGQMAFKLRFD